MATAALALEGIGLIQAELDAAGGISRHLGVPDQARSALPRRLVGA
jgi:hypothetical protein